MNELNKAFIIQYSIQKNSENGELNSKRGSFRNCIQKAKDESKGINDILISSKYIECSKIIDK
ncbi:hypothetical protein LF65_06915 [Clostridium beijerinckii]|uniref:Uncharacterized protein n=1 Tax=Clostridium beijerinckii TaxID=1520 RepID=A0A140DMK8_CLOBE|nr:hypothetical protein LF65_06915 [Clostridium beijerinckii]